MQLLVVHREREDADIESTVAELAEDLLGLLLDQQRLELGEPTPDPGNDVRQQVRTERREQPDAERRRLGVRRPVRDLADVVGLAEHDPGPLDDPLDRRRST